MSQGRLFDAPPATRCGYCARPLTPHPTVPGAFACPRCRPLLDGQGGRFERLGEWERYPAVLAWFGAFVREAHRDRVSA